jgi:Ca2+-binding RTX toxin-like protein
MSLKNKIIAGLAALALVGCGPTEEPKDYGDISGVEEIAQPLAALATAPTFASGTLTVVLASGETAIISKHAVSGNILVNDVATTGATSTAVKKIDITGHATGTETLILDFANGTFAPGIASSAGIVAALGGGNDILKIRGAGATADAFVVGGTNQAIDIAFNVDAYKDISVTATAALGGVTFSLGGGADTFTALTGANGTGGAAYTGDLTVYGGIGDDVLTGGDGDDTFYGDLGNDTLNGGTSNADSDVYNGGAGTDTVTYAARTLAIDVTVGAGADDGETVAAETDDVKLDVEIVRGGSGADTFTGNTGDQTFYGGAGNDTFLMGLLASTGAGNDTVYGEAGIDTVSYAARIQAVTVTMDLNVANDGDAAGTETDNVRDDVENVICPTGAFACTVTGNALDNTLTCGGGVDTFVGGAGDDTFVVGASNAGADVFTGGAGIDKMDFSAYGAVVTYVMDGTTAGTASKVIGADIENFTCPSASICTITGNALNNRIYGSSAADVIDAAGGDDFIEGVGGNDDVTCGDGSDIWLKGAGTPTNAAADCEL